MRSPGSMSRAMLRRRSFMPTSVKPRSRVTAKFSGEPVRIHVFGAWSIVGAIVWAAGVDPSSTLPVPARRGDVDLAGDLGRVAGEVDRAQAHLHGSRKTGAEAERARAVPEEASPGRDHLALAHDR